jgi:hypothetical protein
MSLYTCHGDNPEDLAKAERLKKIFLSVAFENRLLIAPRELEEYPNFHFGYTNGWHRVCRIEMYFKNSRIKELGYLYEAVEKELGDMVVFLGTRINYD